MSSVLSDHFLININASLQKQSVSYIKYKSIDMEAFLTDLWVSSLVLDDVDHLDVDHPDVDLYDSTVGDIRDKGNVK